MRLTDEQRKAVRHPENVLLVACPGSGKTRAIIAKLLRCAEEVRGTARRIACITYTNAAVHEIEYRLRSYGVAGEDDLCEVSTIHTFCLNNILRRFYWRLTEYCTGFTILPPEDERYQEIVALVCDEYGLQSRDREAFELSSREPDGTPVGSLASEVMLDFWKRLRLQGFIDFPNIVYYSYRLTRDYPSIVDGLACRFAWVLVDEFQDTSVLQVEILKLIAARNRSRFFLVGDPCQSIFGFAGARPALMSEFAGCVNAGREFSLTGNFRSSPEVIGHAEALIPRVPAMIAKGESRCFSDKPIYVHASTALEAITDHFLPTLDNLGIEYGEAAILAPSWFSLFPIGRHLREQGIPVYGPGARPYRKSRMIAQFAEQICAYLDSRRPQYVKTLERDLFMLVQQLTGEPAYVIFTYTGRIILFRLLALAQQGRYTTTGAADWLRLIAEGFADILIESNLCTKHGKETLIASAEDIIRDMGERNVDPNSFSVESLGMFAVPDRSLKLLTMHRAKGREFEAVAIIDLHDSTIPHWRSHADPAALEEQLRLLYVAVTRARRFVMYATDSGRPRNVRSRFLSSVLLL